MPPCISRSFYLPLQEPTTLRGGRGAATALVCRNSLPYMRTRFTRTAATQKNKPQRILTPTFARANTNNPSSNVLAHTVRPHPLPYVAFRTARRSPSYNTQEPFEQHTGAFRTTRRGPWYNTQEPLVQHPGALAAQRSVNIPKEGS
ncbi:unnamed protein product [Ectocarpus sp. 12 AP-2014]